jgi:hypothetical protein
MLGVFKGKLLGVLREPFRGQVINTKLGDWGENVLVCQGWIGPGVLVGVEVHFTLLCDDLFAEMRIFCHGKLGFKFVFIKIYF